MFRGSAAAPALLVLLASASTAAFSATPALSSFHRPTAVRGGGATSLTMAEQPKNIVVCGGGIVAASLAYQLSLRGVSATVVERASVAAAASGKAGGFLARGWGSGPTRQLHEVSFDMHEQLAKDLGLKGWRKLPTLSVSGGKRSNNVQAGMEKGEVPTWLDQGVSKASLMATDTAQTTPFELTNAMMDAAVANGASVKIGKVEGMKLDGDKVVGVVVDGETVPADCVVIAMGPWSCMAEDWFPDFSLPMEGVRSTSVVFKTETAVDPFALFCAEDNNGCHLEVYPRNSNEIYLCGIGGSQYLNNQMLKKVSPEEITADPARVKAAEKSFGAMASIGSKGSDIQQACMRPCPPDALPYMGVIPGMTNAYMAAGHNCWGILWAPVTGKAMTELILDGKASCVDLSAFDPGRFTKRKGGDAKGKRGRAQGEAPVGEQW
mmetsp:Transcript_50407/g.119893  ORF Transcript_50407/g.119893 Transcript_50407/m.119893 type:complete len:436 (-) Transcript_50407:50-1357(-)